MATFSAKDDDDVSSSSDCERESSFVGVKNEETEGNFKDISSLII